MLSKHLKRILAVLMASTVIASTAAVSLPLHASAASSLSQTYGIANYDPEREFQPKRYGDIIQYGKNQLQFSMGQTNRIPTGIWASPEEKLKVYVQADANDPLPSLYFVQHIGMWQDLMLQKEVPLQRGMNEIIVPKTFSDASKFTVPSEPGGAIYILNPYTEAQQSSNVRIYIEGGDKFPAFKSGDDIKAFVKELKEYRAGYENDDPHCHNIAEFHTEYTCLTLTLDRVYDAIAKEGLNPQTVVENTDNFFRFMMEEDNLEPSEYQHLYQHVKVNQPYAGAYAYFDIVGIQDNGWSGSLFSNEYG